MEETCHTVSNSIIKSQKTLSSQIRVLPRRPGKPLREDGEDEVVTAGPVSSPFHEGRRRDVWRRERPRVHRRSVSACEIPSTTDNSHLRPRLMPGEEPQKHRGAPRPPAGGLRGSCTCRLHTSRSRVHTAQPGSQNVSDRDIRTRLGPLKFLLVPALVLLSHFPETPGVFSWRGMGSREDCFSKLKSDRVALALNLSVKTRALSDGQPAPGWPLTQPQRLLSVLGAL